MNRRTLFKFGLGIAGASVISGLGLTLGGVFARRHRVDSDYSRPVGSVAGVVASVGDTLPLYDVSDSETAILGNDKRPIPAGVSLCVKYTLVDADVFGDCETLTEYRDSHGGLETALLDVIDGQFVAFPEVWCTHDGYCAQVGSTDALVGGDIREVIFARANNEAEILDGIAYDRDTGVVYIPPEVFAEDNTIQMQLVYAYSFANGVPTVHIDYDVSSEAASGVEAISDTVDVSLFGNGFELPIATPGTDLLTEQIRVYLNGSASRLQDGQWNYDMNTGTIRVFITPFAIETVHVDVISRASKAFGLTSASMDFAVSKQVYPDIAGAWHNYKEGISLYMPDTGFEPGDVITYMAPSAADVVYNIRWSPWLNSLYGYYTRESDAFYDVIYYNQGTGDAAVTNMQNQWRALVTDRIKKVMNTYYGPAPDTNTVLSHWTVFSVDLYGNGMYTTDGSITHGLADTLAIYGDWHIKGSGENEVTFRDLNDGTDYAWVVYKTDASKRLADALRAMTARAKQELPINDSASGLRNYVRMPLLCTHIGQSSSHTLDVGDFENLREGGADSQYRSVKFSTNGIYNIIPAPVRLRILDKHVSSDPEKSYVIFGIISAAFYAGDTWGYQCGSGVYKVHLVSEGRLVVKKETKGPDADANKLFTFNVKFSGKNAPADATFKLHSGQEKAFDKLPIGVTYNITETADGQYSVTWDGAVKGTIKDSVVRTVTATNTRKSGKLRVRKDIVNGNDADKAKKFHFIVTVNNDKGAFYKKFEFDLCENDGWHELEPIPSDYTYTVHENVPPDYTCVQNDLTGVISADKTSSVTVANESHGFLQLTKAVTE